MRISFNISLIRKFKTAIKSVTKIQAISICVVLLAIILGIILGVILSGGSGGSSGFVTPSNVEPKCVEKERTFHPTINGFEERTDHISECLQTCGNEGNSETSRWGKIINGITPDMNSWPFLVKLYIYFGAESNMCGGTVLNSRKRSKFGHVIGTVNDRTPAPITAGRYSILVGPRVFEKMGHNSSSLLRKMGSRQYRYIIYNHG